MAARKDGAVVIEAAINGETRPEKTPHVPRTPEAISRDALTCLSAGAALIHAHNDDIRPSSSFVHRCGCWDALR